MKCQIYLSGKISKSASVCGLLICQARTSVLINRVFSKYWVRQTRAKGVDPDKILLKASFVQSLHCLSIHYENTPIQIYRKFHPQKLKIFR